MTNDIDLAAKARGQSANFGMSPSHLSGLENGLGTPTQGEEKKIREWMEE